eukprot:12881853-Prorocentrum_lima.AAC.1
MKRVLNAEYGPDLTISGAAESSFRTLAIVARWVNSAKLSTDWFHVGYLREYPPILLHMMIEL